MRTQRLCLALACLALVACQTPVASANPTAGLSSPVANTATYTNTASPTQLPTATMSQASPTAWHGYPVTTLAPFPLSAQELRPTLPYAPATPPNGPVAMAPNDHFFFTWPLDRRGQTPSQRYGVFQDPGDSRLPHLGLDFSLNAGTPIRAASDGEVVWADYGLFYRSASYLDDPYGISVVLQHSFGYQGQTVYTVYAHLRETAVELGDRVSAGQVVGLSGNTGLSSGPHLHFEVRVGQNTVYFTRNPELWLAPSDGHGVLVGRITDNRDQPLAGRLVEVRNLADRRRYDVYTYATGLRLLPDDYYNENFVLSELPAGHYEISIPHFGQWQRVEVEIRPGEISYFRFAGSNGYSFDVPANAQPNNTP